MSHFERHGRAARTAVARELREAAAARQLTLTDLSAATGIARSTLTRKLRGHGDLTVVELVWLAIVLEIPAADLVGLAIEAASGGDPGHGLIGDIDSEGSGSPFSGGER